MGLFNAISRARRLRRPDLREPGINILGKRSIFRPQARSPLQNAFDNIRNAPQPILQQPQTPLIGGINPGNVLPPVVGGPALPPIDPRIIPQRPIIPPKRNDFMSIERINEPKNEFIPSMPNETPSPFIPPPPLQPVLQQPQPIGVPSLMDPRQPQPNLATGVIDPVSQPILQAPQGPQIIPQVPNPFEKPFIPPKRDNFISIGGPGGGFTDNRVLEQQPFVPPQQPTFTPISERTDIYGAGKDYDPANLPEGYSFNNQGPARVRTAVMPPPGFVYAYGPDGDRISVPSGAPGAEELRNQPPTILRDFPIPPPTVQEPLGEPIMTPAPTTPAAVADDVGAVPPTTIPADTRGQIDPVLAQQDSREVLSDPALRALYFGTADQPGFLNQLQQTGANLLGAELPSTQYDPSMTEQYYNPYEDRVVQQTLQDVFKFADKQDIAQRARDIQTGGLSAFGSRAKLTAAERQEALGRGLAESLSGIRSQGFTQAQRTGIDQFGNQYNRQMAQVDRPLNVLQGIGSLLPRYAGSQTTIDSQYRMPVDPTSAGLGAAFTTYSALKPNTQQTG